MVLPIPVNSSMLPEQIIQACNNSVAVPAIIIGFIAFSIVFLFVGLAVLKDFDNKKKLLIIWAISTFVAGFIYIFIAVSPLLIQNLINWINGVSG